MDRVLLVGPNMFMLNLFKNFEFVLELKLEQ